MHLQCKHHGLLIAMKMKRDDEKEWKDMGTILVHIPNVLGYRYHEPTS